MASLVSGEETGWEMPVLGADTCVLDAMGYMSSSGPGQKFILSRNPIARKVTSGTDSLPNEDKRRRQRRRRGMVDHDNYLRARAEYIVSGPSWAACAGLAVGGSPPFDRRQKHVFLDA